MSRFSPMTKLSQSAGGKRGDASVMTTKTVSLSHSLSQFVSTLNGFSATHSANTLRNSVTPMRFAKSERFPKIKSDTSNVDYHQPELRDLDQNWHSHKRVRLWLKLRASVSALGTSSRSKLLIKTQALACILSALISKAKHRLLRNAHLDSVMKK